MTVAGRQALAVISAESRVNPAVQALFKASPAISVAQAALA
jgi:hypothetical protein